MYEIYLDPDRHNVPLINSKIPKIMFQTWETHDIEPEFQKIINLWKEYNPDYKYILHDSNERREFIKNNFDENTVRAFDKILPGGAKCDFWKYCILHVHGGFSFDLDTLCMGKLDDLIHDNVDFIVPVDLNSHPLEGDHNLAAGFIGSVPKHPIFLEAINKIVNNTLNNIVPPSRLDFTGPGMLGRAVNIYLKQEETSSFKNKEGVRNNINFLYFDPETEYMTDTTNNKTILQNKNKNADIIRLYNAECSKIKNFTCWVTSKNLIDTSYK
jgi:mannosyltransferase OCH1-like enzyme